MLTLTRDAQNASIHALERAVAVYKDLDDERGQTHAAGLLADVRRIMDKVTWPTAVPCPFHERLPC